jgi:hypothetical protein
MSFDRSEGGRLPSRRPFAPRDAERYETQVQPGPAEPWLDPVRSMGHRHASGVVAMSEEARREAEEFLDRVFGPLVSGPELTRHPRSNTTTNSDLQSGLPRGEVGTVTALRTRVPGENFALIEDDPSTIAAERAIDIRSALSKFDEGRRAAKDNGEEQPTPSR